MNTNDRIVELKMRYFRRNGGGFAYAAPNGEPFGMCVHKTKLTAAVWLARMLPWAECYDRNCFINIDYKIPEIEKKVLIDLQHRIDNMNFYLKQGGIK